METIDFPALINDAIATHNWALLVVAILCLAVPVVLTALGKNIPIVGTILSALLSFFKNTNLTKPKVVAVETTKPAPGIEQVVVVVKEDEKKP